MKIVMKKDQQPARDRRKQVEDKEHGPPLACWV